MNNNLLIAFFVTFGVIGIIIWGITSGSKATESKPNVQGVSVVQDSVGKQVINILAKGGYSPSLTKAEANKPTILNIETKNTFDCSSALVIPALKIQKNLPPTGITTIEIPPQTPGTKLDGTCGMGMYNFSINFQES